MATIVGDTSPSATASRFTLSQPLTLHPSFPLIRLFSVQESHILVSPDGRGEPNCERNENQRGKRPYVVLFLFFQEHARSIGQEEVEDGASEDGKRHSCLDRDKETIVFGCETWNSPVPRQDIR
jgi:hypothetical protein